MGRSSNLGDDMQVVVVLAHPQPASFTHAIAAAATDELRAAGHSVTIHDLYAEGFGAAMTALEHHAYHGDAPVLDPLVQQHISDITAADTVVFVYPTWWSSLPAILKGWLERVMVPGVGFKFNRNNKVRPGLTNVRRIVGISTYGSPRLYVKLMNDNGRRTLLRALHMSTGSRTRTSWIAMYGCDNANVVDRQTFLADVRRRMRRL